MIRGQEQPWQRNPDAVTTEPVQLWSDSGSLVGTVSLEFARDRVSSGRMFVISDQAIGVYARRRVFGEAS